MEKDVNIQELIQQALKNKPVSVRQISKFAKETYGGITISEKAINEYLYGEAYEDCRMYSSCESFERELV